MKVRETIWKGDWGEGSIFFRCDREGRRVSSNLYLSYRAGRKEYVVSAKTDDLADAKSELKRLVRNRENAREGKEPLQTPKAEKITVGELLDANLRRAEEEKLLSIVAVRSRTETLKALLGKVKAIEFRPEHVDSYKERRRAEKKAPATIHHELEVLHRAFAYAKERGVLRFAPFVEMPKVDNVSEREFPPERLPELLERLRRRDEALADVVEFMAHTSRRPEGLRRLTWDLFDVKTWTLTIPPEKKGNEVLIGLSGTLRAIMERRIQARRLGCDLIFHRKGRPMGEDKDRDVFAAVCKEMELPYGRKDGFTIYTVKSTSVGLQMDAGLTDAEIMDRGGWKTNVMMLRYRKQNPERAHASSVKFEEHMARLADKIADNADRIAEFPK